MSYRCLVILRNNKKRTKKIVNNYPSLILFKKLRYDEHTFLLSANEHLLADCKKCYLYKYGAKLHKKSEIGSAIVQKTPLISRLLI